MHDVADLSLSGEGSARIDWADEQMPVLRQIRTRFELERPLDGLLVGACLHVTAETANLCRALIAGGARLLLCASNPLTTQDDTAAALVERFGVEVHAARGESPVALERHIAGVVAAGPQITIDDGADLVLGVHASNDGVETLIGGTEETRPASSGCARWTTRTASSARSSPSTRRAPSARSTTATAPASP